MSKDPLIFWEFRSNFHSSVLNVFNLLVFRVPVLKFSNAKIHNIVHSISSSLCVVFENLSHSKVDTVMNFIQTIYLLFRCVWTLLPSYLSGMERCWTLSVTQALNGNQLLYYSSWYLKNKCRELWLSFAYCLILS